MPWNNYEIEKHKRAALLLTEVMNEAFLFIEKNQNTTEKEVEQYIFKRLVAKKLKTDRKKFIVAFDENSAIPHYHPDKNCKKLKPNTFILIDIWARLIESQSPFADITWVGYFGKTIPKNIKDVFNLAIQSRDLTISTIESALKKNILLTGQDIHNAVSQLIIDKGFEKNILHATGHTLGFHSPHGKGQGVHLNKSGDKKLQINLGYAIEPGIYLANKFGIRSEINFFINNSQKIIITTPKQKKVILIKPSNICS